MAPEQISGREVDGRTDQYSLACVAFQLLTGEVPFRQEQLPAMIYAHLSAPPPSLVSRRPDLPVAVDQVVAKAMAKTAEKRSESCGDFADALREALGLTAYHRRSSADTPSHPLPTAPPSAASASSDMLADRATDSQPDQRPASAACRPVARRPRSRRATSPALVDPAARERARLSRWRSGLSIRCLAAATPAAGRCGYDAPSADRH